MIKDLLILPDGREISSGAQEPVSIESLCYTRQVNAGENLDLGSACAAQLEVKLLDTTGSFSLESGTPLRHFRVDEAGNRCLMGTFYPESVTRPGKYILEFTAYDAMVKAEQELTSWLAALPDWPYTIRQLLEMVCAHCGIPLDTDISLCNGEYSVLRFARTVTGRQLIAWVAGANGMYAWVTAEGVLTFSGYGENPAPITPGDCKQLKIAQMPCAPIARVGIGQDETDLAAIWPENGEGECYHITANPLLTAFSQEQLTQCAKNVYERLAGFTYTPIEAEVFADTVECPWQPGELVQVEQDGEQVCCAIFQIQLSGSGAKLKSTGSPHRDSASSRYSRDTVHLLQGQMTRVTEEITGVSTQVSRVEAELEEQQMRVQEDVSALQVEADKIWAQVSQTETATQANLALLEDSVETLKKQAELAVTAGQVEIAISAAMEKGAGKVVTQSGYTFDESGLTIATDRSDIKNLLDHTGMQVTRGQEILLRADTDGVAARDVTVHNYLIIGTHARVEDYQTGRTACFWL